MAHANIPHVLMGLSNVLIRIENLSDVMKNGEKMAKVE